MPSARKITIVLAATRSALQCRIVEDMARAVVSVPANALPISGESCHELLGGTACSQLSQHPRSIGFDYR